MGLHEIYCRRQVEDGADPDPTTQSSDDQGAYGFGKCVTFSGLGCLS